MKMKLLKKVNKQVNKCYELYGKYASFSEAMAILEEEHRELWQEHSKHQLDFDRIEAEIVDNIMKNGTNIKMIDGSEKKFKNIYLFESESFKDLEYVFYKYIFFFSVNT